MGDSIQQPFVCSYRKNNHDFKFTPGPLCIYSWFRSCVSFETYDQAPLLTLPKKRIVTEEMMEFLESFSLQEVQKGINIR